MATVQPNADEEGKQANNSPDTRVRRRKQGVTKMTGGLVSLRRDSVYDTLMKALSGVDNDLGIDEHSDFLLALSGKSLNESMDSNDQDAGRDVKDSHDNAEDYQEALSPRRTKLQRAQAFDQHETDAEQNDVAEDASDFGSGLPGGSAIPDIQVHSPLSPPYAMEDHSAKSDDHQCLEYPEDADEPESDRLSPSDIELADDDMVIDGSNDIFEDDISRADSSRNSGDIKDDDRHRDGSPESEEGGDSDDSDDRAAKYRRMMERMRGRQKSMQISGSRRGSLTIAGRRDSIVDPNYVACCRRNSMTVYSFSESYFAVKGAALILPQSECPRTVTKGSSHGGDIQHHLQSMFYLLRPQDTIKVAVKLEGIVPSRVRYMAVVSTVGRQDTEESVILGIDIVNQRSTIGMVLPVWSGTVIRLDGDGGFSVTANERHHVFKPVSVQAMWSALQSLIKASEVAGIQRYFPRGLTHTWVSYYEANIKSDQVSINEWLDMQDIESHRTEPLLNTKSDEELALEKTIKAKLKDIMMQVDLEEVTSKVLRTRLEQELGMDLKSLRHFIDEEMIIILRQMDSPSPIFDYLYLGSEWNASNLEELRENGVECILNVTREIDNFFPGMFDYKNIRLYDVEQSDLLKHWEDTYKFIKKAKMSDSKVLVHCKMGISRSASTVIAFAMKEYDLSFEEAYDLVKKKRNCIKPNNGFLQQLITYQGILDASRQRHNSLWRSRSTGNLLETVRKNEDHEDLALMETMAMNIPIDLASPSNRPRSWSPEDNTAQLLLKTRDLASDDDSSEAENQGMGDGMSDVNPSEPLHPAFFSWDDIDDFEMSSRSADSIDEVEQETPLERKCEHQNGDPNIVLISHKTFDWDDEPERESQEAGDADAITEESEVDDVVGEENAGRPEKGFYDVSMFYVNLAPSEEGGPPEEEEERGLNYYLHPDIKIELLFALQRKHRHIAQLLKLSQRQLKDSSPNSVPVVRLDADSTEVPNPQPVFTKLREDSSWIKPVEISPEPMKILEQTTEAVVDDASLQVLEDATVDESSTDIMDNKEPVIDSETMTEDPDQTYKKEDIPWNAGTVKNVTKDFEQRIQVSVPKSRKRSRSASTSSTSSSSLGSGDEAANESNNAKTEFQEAVMDTTLHKDTKGLPSSDEVSEIDAQQLEKQQEAAAAAARPTSIYDTEEIPLEPGIVRRTKQEIESRKNVDVPAEPSVQFTINQKDDRNTKKDRKSDRLSTGMPTLQESAVKVEVGKEAQSKPSKLKEETEMQVVGVATGSAASGSTKTSSCTTGSDVTGSAAGLAATGSNTTRSCTTGSATTGSVAAGSATNSSAAIGSGTIGSPTSHKEDTQRRVCKIGQEAVEMPVGIVDKLHREYSVRAKDEGEGKDRAQSPLEEEGLEIRSGSVKRQLQQIQKVSKPSATATSETVSEKPTSNDLTKQPHVSCASNAVPAVSVISTTSTAKITLSTSGVTQSNTATKPLSRLISAPEGATEATSVITDLAVAQTAAAGIKSTTHVSASKSPTTKKDKIKSQDPQKDPTTCVSSPRTSPGTDVSVTADSDDITNTERSQGDPLSPDCCFESQSASSAYKEQDISWSVGKVKQHKEAIEHKLNEKTGSVSASRRESQSCESASLSVKDSPLHDSKQSSTPILEAASEKLTLTLKKLDPAKSPPAEEKQRRLFIVEKNSNLQKSPEKDNTVKVSTKSSSIVRSHSLKETKTTVVTRPRSHTDSSTSLEAPLETSPILSPLSSPCSPPEGGPDPSQDHSDSDCSEKSDSQSVKDLRGFFETKDANIIDRSKRPSSLHGTECSTTCQQHKKVTMTSSLDSVALQVKEEMGQSSIPETTSPVRPSNCHGSTNNCRNAKPSDPVTSPTSPAGDSEMKVRRQHGKSHPLTRLAQESGGVRIDKAVLGGRRSSNPVYNTM